ncbi:iron(III) ABC transporter, ATP-binding protein, putative [Kordia algicida OT-1]|uniref:Iron(III) ABC transporter, ATP-binding protein, putative n=1 Tax=Kordia algicida OT-1 TaxID=391587 RepID=A9DYE3_9FLAO|nr:iron(III) ABC transporter, ATP-binding protein, putative [Kordia algicida OT-1]
MIAEAIDVTISRGKLVALVGANGIGKSTLLRTLAKIQEPLSGEILLQNKLLHSYSNAALAREISLVLTEQIPSKNLTVVELIALGRQPYTNWIGNLSKNDHAIVESALKKTNLLELKHRKCYTLSDGQLQKVMIARALAQDTSMIILDEPTTHLDMYHKAYVLNLLKKLAHDTQKTMLFSTHEIDLAIQLCDEMIVMNNGSVFSGTPCELIEQGIFEALFPNDLITFDASSGSFKVKNTTSKT